MIKRRLYSLAVVLLAMGVVILIPRKDVAKAPDPESSGVIRISKETTRISGPLKKNGNVDYLAAINKELSSGVTPANNAAVPIWQAFGRQDLVPELVDEFFRRLGMTPPPENGEYYISLANFLEKEHLASGGEDTVAAISAVRDKATRVFDKVMSEPWSQKKYPQVVRWLKRNERTLKMAHEASRRTHYYMPYITGGEEQEEQEEQVSLVMMLLPGVVHGRIMGRLLVIDGFGHIGSGTLQKAREDFLACHRLGRVCSKGGTLIEGLVGSAIDGIAIRGEIALVEHGGLSVDQLRSYQQQLEQLSPFASMVEKITVLERYLFLDVTQNLARHGPKVLREIGGDSPIAPPLLESVGKGFFSALVDWNIVLKMGNEAYDRIEKIGAIKSFSEREKEFEKFEKEIEEMTVRLGTASGLAKQLLLSGKNVRQVASEQMGGVLIALLLPAVTRAVDVSERGMMNTQMVQTAMALSMFQKQHGRYPARLGELVPVFITKVPTDIYAGKPVRYFQQGDGFYLYSVGRNHEDEGGRSQDDVPVGDDMGYKVNFPSPGAPGISE